MAKGLELRLEGNFDQVEAGRQHLACGVAAVPFHALGPGALHAERAAAKPNALEVVDIEDYHSETWASPWAATSTNAMTIDHLCTLSLLFITVILRIPSY